MDADIATRIKAHMETAMKEAHQALLLVQAHCTEEEFDRAKRDTGFLLAHGDNFLCESVYKYHPELDELHDETGSKPFMRRD